MTNLIVSYIATGTLAFHLSTNAVSHAHIGRRLDELSHWQYAWDSGTNLANLTNAPWSTNFWLSGVQGLSATCIGFSNSLAGQGLVSLVSPRHYLFATHMHPEDMLAAFLDTNNTVYWRRTLQRVNVGNDTSVGILDRDLPSSVGFLPVLPTNFSDYLSSTGRIQGIGMNQNLCLFGEPMILGDSIVTWNSSSNAPSGLEKNWNVTIRGGDSSDPALLLIGNQLVLVSHNSFVNGGPNYAMQSAAINRRMHELSTNNHADTDYQLTVFSLTNWPVIKQ